MSSLPNSKLTSLLLLLAAALFILDPVNGQVAHQAQTLGENTHSRTYISILILALVLGVSLVCCIAGVLLWLLSSLVQWQGEEVVRGPTNSVQENRVISSPKHNTEHRSAPPSRERKTAKDVVAISLSEELQDDALRVVINIDPYDDKFTKFLLRRKDEVGYLQKSVRPGRGMEVVQGALGAKDSLREEDSGHLKETELTIRG